MNLFYSRVLKLFPAFFEQEEARKLRIKELQDKINHSQQQAKHYRYSSFGKKEEYERAVIQAQAELKHLTQKPKSKFGGLFHV